MKVFIGTPVRDNVTPEYAQSLLMAGLDCKERDIEIVPNIIRNSCFVDVARSVLVDNFLQTDCTHLFYVDSDIGYEAHALAGLVQSEAPLCAGAYPKREGSQTFALQVHEPQELKGPWLRVDRVATGFMCIERKILEVMSAQAPMCTVQGKKIPMVFRTVTAGTFVGEDYCFCDDYNRLYSKGVFDEPIWVYPDITFNHDGFVGNLHESLLSSENEDVPGRVAGGG